MDWNKIIQIIIKVLAIIASSFGGAYTAINI
jgi:hypothetical protein